MKNVKEFRTLFRFLKTQKLRLVIASLMLVISSLVGLLFGYLMGEAIQAITNLEIKKSLICLGLGFFNSVVFSGIIYELGVKMFKKVETYISSKIGEAAYRKVLDLPTTSFEVRSSGEFINRITNDTDALSDVFAQLLDTVESLVGCIIILVYVFLKSWLIGLEIVVLVFIMLLVVRHYTPLIKKNSEAIKEKHDEYTSLTTESIRGIREIKTLGIKNNLFTNIQDIVKKLLANKNSQISAETNFSIWKSVVASLIETVVFATCAILLYYKRLDLSFFVAMTYYVYRYTWIVQNITHTSKMYQKALVAITRINEIIENRIFEDEKFGLENITECTGIIKFENVGFGYKENEIVLDNLNVVFEPGKKIALVGKSGQGKSTIFNLITRIYNPLKGTVFIDERKIEEFSEESLRNHVSIIRQEPFIFNRSIKENFKMVNPRISLKEIREYSTLACLDDFINSLPKKYDTILGEGGTNLSGGQKQRLAIARVLAKKSKIILLDEATSALDNESQMYINKTIDNLVKDHTVIIVAHRLSTIIDADIIYVVDKGKIVAKGTHIELIQTSKVYQNLYNSESIES